MSERLTFQFNATHRTQTGKKFARRLRKEKKIPAIVYGADQPPMPLTLNLKDVMKTLSNEAVYSHILTLQIEDKAEKVVLKALNRHHLKPEVTHMDFLRIKAGEHIIMYVPLHFIGESTCPGVKDQGGIASHQMKDLEIKCLPENLPEYIEVDISTLKLDNSIHLSQIQLPTGIELVTEVDEEHDPVVVSIARPRVEKSPEEISPAEETEKDEKDAEKKPEE